MLPEGWKAYSLIDITKWSSGSTPSKSENDFWGGDIPWISAVSMKGIFYSDSDLKVTEKALKHSAKVANENDILLLVRGSMLWNKIPVGIATRAMAFNQDVKCIKADTKKVDVRFLLYWFLAKEKHLLGMVTGTGIGAGKLDTSELQSLDIYLPCLPEQKKVAQILSTWDNAISATERLLDNSQQRKKALMQQLLTGKKRLPGFEGEFKHVELSGVASITMGTSPKSESYNEEGDGLPLIQGNADIECRKSKPRIFTSEVTKTCFPGDILLSVRAPVGTIAISNHEACIGRGICALRATKGNNQDYLYQWMLWYEPRWSSLSQGSTFESVNSTDIKSLKLILPSFIEQQAIANILTTADQEIDAQQKRLEHLKLEKKALMQQLLTGKRRVVADADAA